MNRLEVSLPVTGDPPSQLMLQEWRRGTEHAVTQAPPYEADWPYVAFLSYGNDAALLTVEVTKHNGSKHRATVDLETLLSLLVKRAVE